MIPPPGGGRAGGPLISLDPSRGNAHSLVFSGSGSFKTAGVAIPNALTYAGPLIVVDPKGEIYDLTAPVRRARGRRPWLITADRGLDPVRLLTALRPKDGTVFSDLAEFMLPTTGTVLSDGSAFFHQKSVRVLTALLAHLHHKNAVGHLFAKANALLAMETAALRTQFKEHAEDWREKGRDYDFITTVLAEVAATEDRQLSGVLATVANGLAWSGQPAIRGFLFSRKVSDAPARSDGTPVGQVLLDRVLDPLTDIYIRLPTEVMQGHPGVARALIGALVRTVRDSMPASASRGNAVHRLFILDEARALRRMDYLAAVRDEGRAQGIHLMQIFQSYQQLLECYGTFGAGAWVNSVDRGRDGTGIGRQAGPGAEPDDRAPDGHHGFAIEVAQQPDVHAVFGRLGRLRIHQLAGDGAHSPVDAPPTASGNRDHPGDWNGADPGDEGDLVHAEGHGGCGAGGRVQGWRGTRGRGAACGRGGDRRGRHCGSAAGTGRCRGRRPGGTPGRRRGPEAADAGGRSGRGTCGQARRVGPAPRGRMVLSGRTRSPMPKRSLRSRRRPQRKTLRKRRRNRTLPRTTSRRNARMPNSTAAFPRAPSTTL